MPTPRKPPKKQPAPKRRAKAPLVRGEPVVMRVLVAAVEELARSGYKALRVEDVARRAGVNKTTVYRRWPEKSALVRDALLTFTEETFGAPATGSLREDLLALGRTMRDVFAQPLGQSVVRMLVAEGSDPEVAALKRAVRGRHEAIPRDVIAAAEHRGELSQERDHEVLFLAFMSAIQHRTFFEGEPVTDAFLVQLVDLLLDGARPRSAKGERRPARRR